MRFERAACLGADPAIFFPTTGHTLKPAKAICAGCPAKAQCLEYAVPNRHLTGVWGGTSYKERTKIRLKK